MRQELEGVLTGVDALITPTAPTVAHPIGQPFTQASGQPVDIFSLRVGSTVPFDITGSPAISVPCGLSSDGLPIGLQIVGRAWDEPTVLRSRPRTSRPRPGTSATRAVARGTLARAESFPGWRCAVRPSPDPRSPLVALAVLLAACSAPAAAPPAKPAAAVPTAASTAPVAAPASGSVAPAQPAAREPVAWTMGRIGNATFHSPFYIAINKGFLREQGLAPELVVLPTPEQIAGLVSGSLNISMSSTDATALAVARGQPLRQVMGYQSKWPYNLVAQPQYTLPEDLKGTTVGVEAINISTGRMTDLFLRKYGLERGRDYEVAVSGNNLERYAAIRNGSVSAAMLADPGNFQALDQGFSPRHARPGAAADGLPGLDGEPERRARKPGAVGRLPEGDGEDVPVAVRPRQQGGDAALLGGRVQAGAEDRRASVCGQHRRPDVEENGRINREAIAALLDDMRGNNVFEGLAVPTVDHSSTRATSSRPGSSSASAAERLYSRVMACYRLRVSWPRGSVPC